MRWSWLRDEGLGFVLLLVLILGNAGLAHYNALGLVRTEQRVARTHATLIGLEAVLSSLHDAEAGQRGYLLTGDDDYLGPYRASHDRTLAQLRHLRDFAADQPDPQRYLKDLGSLTKVGTARYSDLDELIELRRTQGLEAARKVVGADRGRELMDEAQHQVNQLEQEQRGFLAARADEAAEQARYVRLANLIAALVGVSLVVGAIALSRRGRWAGRRAAVVLFGERERFRVTLASIADAVITTDPSRQVTFLNDTAAALTGRDAADATGRPLDEIFHAVTEEGRRPAPDPTAAALSEGRPIRPTERTLLVARDGRERPIEVSAAPIRDDRGRVTGTVVVVRDVTERRHHEEELRKSEARARRLSSSDVVGVLYWTTDGRIDWANDELLRVVGYDRADVEAGRLRWDRLIPPNWAARNAEMWEELKSSRRFQPREREMLRRDGGTVPTIVGGALFDGSDHEGVAFVLDNSARKRLEADLRQHAQAMAEADRRKDEFLLMLAHELRNPLAPIRNAAHLLRLNEPDGPDVRWAVDIIDRQSRQLARLIEDLLDVARLTRGLLQLHRERAELRPIVETAVETSRPLLDAAGQTLTVELPTGPVVLEGDPTRLAQVLANLLNNAAKYTPRGGRIDLTAEVAVPDVVLGVRDTGIGIPADLLPRLFEPFVQGPQALDRAQGGLGIGLALVRWLVEMHGGTVTAHSAGPGHGSEFEVRLPIVVEVRGPGKRESTKYEVRSTK